MARSPGAGDPAALTRRGLIQGLLAGGTLAAAGPALAAPPAALRVGDQKGGARSLLAAAGQDHAADSPLQWSLFAGAPMLIQALAADAIDTGVIGDAPLVFAQGGSDTIRAVAGIQTDGTMTAIVVRHDSPIRSVRDLKGRSVATLRAQTGHYLALAALREAGLHDDDVHFVFIPPVSAKLALQTGAVDAWATWGPYISDAKVADGAREIVNGGRLMSGLSYVVATEAALHTRRDAVADYVRRLRAGHDWMQAHPDEYAAVWAADVGLPIAVAKDVVRAMQGTVVPLGPDVIRKQQAVSDFMFETRMIPRRLAATAVMDTRFTF